MARICYGLPHTAPQEIRARRIKYRAIVVGVISGLINGCRIRKLPQNGPCGSVEIVPAIIERNRDSRSLQGPRLDRSQRISKWKHIETEVMDCRQPLPECRRVHVKRWLPQILIGFTDAVIAKYQQRLAITP